MRLALIAKTGEMGYPSVLTAKTWGFYDVLFKGKPFEFQRPYGSYVMENVLFKISFPAEFHAQTAVECAMQLHPRVKDRLDDIEKITIRTHESAIRIIDKKGPLDNPADRDHCIQYMVAVPLIYGRLTAADYEDDVAADPRIDALRDKMVCVEDKQFTRDYLDPDKRSIANAHHGRVQRRHASSRKSSVEYPIGHRRRRKEGIPLLDREVPHQPRAALSREAAAGDPRRRARRSEARGDAGARVRRPDGDLTAARATLRPMPRLARRRPRARRVRRAPRLRRTSRSSSPACGDDHDDRRARRSSEPQRLDAVPRRFGAAGRCTGCRWA